MQANIGSEQQWQEIELRRPGMIDALNKLTDLAPRIQQTQKALNDTADKIIFALSNQCIEECWEVLLLAANQYAFGATKLLRSLYERVVTTLYLGKYPEKSERFEEYGAIQDHRLLQHSKKLYSDDQLQTFNYFAHSNSRSL
ncbi:MAG TPA: DUF5677 domain-containing protein [Bryobacteraceae bacterium]|jgi:hypothetical protein|nr:DUF5677 domain-containing protein [Bryobacteraceae bacterium]